MNAFRFVYSSAVALALVAMPGVAFSQGCKNHYILEYPCGFPAGTPPPTVDIPPVPTGVKRWTAIGPDGVNVVSLVIDPIAPAIAFAGTTGSGLLKTTDSGASWATASSGLLTTNVLALAIDPAARSTLYAGTDAGVFKSTDGGQSWVAANAGLGGAAQIVVNALAIDPGSPTTLYAGTSGGVFKTTNGATSWTSINAGLTGLAARVITVDPASGSTVYVGVDDTVSDFNYGAFKSTDGGATWTKIYSTPTSEDGGAPPITALVVDPQSPSRLYLLVAFRQLLTSQDGGLSWSDITSPAGDVWSMAVAPTSSETLYVGTFTGLVFRTTDRGAHWTSVSDALQASGVNVIAAAASAPAVLYVGAQNGVFRSSDDAHTWTHPNLGVRRLGVYPLTSDTASSSTIYTAVGGVVMKTTDGGAHWVASTSGLSSDLLIFRLAVDPVDPSVVYAVQSTPFSDPTRIYKSADAGAHWAPASNVVFGPAALRAFAIAPTQPSTIFIGVNSQGVLKSSDGGSSWALASNGLAAIGPYVSALAVDPTIADTVYAATSPTGRPDTPAKLFKSSDGAAHWRNVPIGVPQNTEITSLVVDPAAASTLYAGTNAGVFKSSDGGETWVAAASQNLPPAASIGKLVIGSGSPSALYAATSAGVFASTDGATSWTPINAGLPNVGVSDLAIDETGLALRVATIAGLFEYRLSEASPSSTVPVTEYRHAGFDHYFITADPGEIAALDGGAISGWTRTGLQFNAYAANTSGALPVCRFLTTAFAPKYSHFFTPFAAECAAVQANPDWSLESSAAFYIAIPAADGSCAAGSTPVYRLYNDGQGGAPNHRYTINAAARAQMIAHGWVLEGVGPDKVQMCSPP